MSKPRTESFLDYKRRMIDPVSSSFCAAKWLNATIWLDRGWTTSCHHPPHHKVGRWQLLWNPSALHNTPHKIEQRKKMLAGERPRECDYCWKVEDMHQNSISDRVFKTEVHSDEDVKKIADPANLKKPEIRTLEVSFNRTCNFACSYCNAGFSTTWEQDIKRKGAYSLVSLGGDAFSHDGTDEVLEPEKNPYLSAFWRWWPSLQKTLNEIRITGGEPLLSKDVWKMLDSFREQQFPHLKLAINSNLGAKDELIERFIEASHSVRHLEVYTSNEAVGAQAEYIRDGLSWTRWKSNVLKLSQNGNFKKIHVMMTINALCLFSITDLFDEILSWRNPKQNSIGFWTLNILRFPSFMSPLVLPREMRLERAQHLNSWLKTNRTHRYIHDMEVAGIERLIQYLEHVEAPHNNVSSMELQKSDFRSFFEQYDQRRNKDFKQTFPKILTDWVSQIQILDPSQKDKRSLDQEQDR